MSRQKIKAKRIFWWSFFIFWLIITLILSAQNGASSSKISLNLANKVNFTKSMFDFDKLHFIVRKIAHFTVHTILAFTAVRATTWTFSKRKKSLLVGTSISIVIAIFDEAVQLLSPGRVSVPTDALINIAGVIVGSFVSSRIGPKSLK